MKKRILLIIPIIIIVCIFCYARFIEPNLLVVKTIDIESEKAIKPCTITFFTDTHFGKYYNEDHIEQIVNKINQTNPDIVIFGGDLLDNYARDRDSIDLDYLSEQLQKIEAKVDKFAIWGNHDYGGGAVRVYEQFMTSSDFRVVKNELVEVKDCGITLIGFDDYLMGMRDSSLYKINSDSLNIVASHEPIVSQLLEGNGDNLMLSGHTHGGQVNIPFLTSKFLPEGSGQFVKGFYNEKELNTSISLRMYTSSGIGMTRYPYRFLNPPEIIKINIKKETK